MLALTKEDLQAIRAVVKEEVQEQILPVNQRLDKMDKKLDVMQESIDEIRSTTNSLVAWADEVSVITQVKFPVKKAK